MLKFAAERGGNVEDPNKRNALDFVLWQPSAEGEPAWESLWGPGRPGWHIECSALALRDLGTTIDLQYVTEPGHDITRRKTKKKNHVFGERKLGVIYSARCPTCAAPNARSMQTPTSSTSSCRPTRPTTWPICA